MLQCLNAQGHLSHSFSVFAAANAAAAKYSSNNTAEPVNDSMQGHDQVRHPPKGPLAPQPGPLNPHHSNNTQVSARTSIIFHAASTTDSMLMYLWLLIMLCLCMMHM